MTKFNVTVSCQISPFVPFPPLTPTSSTSRKPISLVDFSTPRHKHALQLPPALRIKKQRRTSSRRRQNQNQNDSADGADVKSPQRIRGHLNTSHFSFFPVQVSSSYLHRSRHRRGIWYLETTTLFIVIFIRTIPFVFVLQQGLQLRNLFRIFI